VCITVQKEKFAALHLMKMKQRKPEYLPYNGKWTGYGTLLQRLRREIRKLYISDRGEPNKVFDEIQFIIDELEDDYDRLTKQE